jgi:hypothetical protein
MFNIDSTHGTDLQISNFVHHLIHSPAKGSNTENAPGAQIFFGPSPTAMSWQFSYLPSLYHLRTTTFDLNSILNPVGIISLLTWSLSSQLTPPALLVHHPRAPTAIMSPHRWLLPAEPGLDANGPFYNLYTVLYDSYQVSLTATTALRNDIYVLRCATSELLAKLENQESHIKLLEQFAKTQHSVEQERDDALDELRKRL